MVTCISAFLEKKNKKNEVFLKKVAFFFGVLKKFHTFAIPNGNNHS